VVVVNGVGGARGVQKILSYFFLKLGVLQCITTFENTKVLLNITIVSFFKIFLPLCVCIKILRILLKKKKILLKTQDYNYDLKTGILLMLCVMNHMGFL